MARPKKATVDYFPHSCAHKTTIFVLEQKYGNDGYAFWFKILELLASSEGHFYDCRKPHLWEFLQAKTRLSEGLCNELLDLLAKLDAIDPELWSKKIIWSDNFVAGIADVYKNRRVEIPSKPSFYEKKPRTADVSTNRNPQSKVKETKVNKSNKPVRKKTEKFKKPTIEEIREYCRERKNTVDPDRFYNFYESKGWMIGKNRMKDWHAAVRTWERDRDQNATPPPQKSLITVEVAKDMLARASTTETMVEVLERLPEDELKLFMKTVVNKDAYTRGLYQRAKKILKKREAT
jgi:hypothetical protein